VPQEEVNIQRPTGAEVDVGAALEFLNSQRRLSFPEDGFLSGGDDNRPCQAFELRTIGEEEKGVKRMQTSSSRKKTVKTELLVPLNLK
jgi:hypothetical protein